VCREFDCWIIEKKIVRLIYFNLNGIAAIALSSSWGYAMDGLKDKLEVALKVKFLPAFLLRDFNVHFNVFWLQWKHI
jgi:hypothetical protein